MQYPNLFNGKELIDKSNLREFKQALPLAAKEALSRDTSLHSFKD